MTGYFVPVKRARSELTIKKSRFIGHIAPATNRQQALSVVDKVAEEFSDARHICWAYVSGEWGNTSAVACNDDSEPSGTAGKPILNVLQQNTIGDAVAIVVRYFGGIKLGAGGLVRAYSSATSAALEAAELKQHVERLCFELLIPYSYEDITRRCLTAHRAEIDECQYNNEVWMRVAAEASERAALEASLTNQSNGEIRFKHI